MRCANTAFKIRGFAVFQVYLSADEWRPDLVGAAALAKCFGGRIGRRLGHDVPAPSNTPCTHDHEGTYTRASESDANPTALPLRHEHALVGNEY